jgi:hypothetical protein
VARDPTRVDAQARRNRSAVPGPRIRVPGRDLPIHVAVPDRAIRARANPVRRGHRVAATPHPDAAKRHLVKDGPRKGGARARWVEDRVVVVVRRVVVTDRRVARRSLGPDAHSRPGRRCRVAAFSSPRA